MKSIISKALLAAFLATGLVACSGGSGSDGASSFSGASASDTGSGNAGAASGGSGLPPSSATPNGPSSETLIGQALANGQINAETAMMYRVLAAFGDARLPAAYRGDDGGVLETGALNDALDQFDSLSAAAQDVLGPFLLRPSSIGSWADQSSGSASAPSQSSVARAAPISMAASAAASRPTCRGEIAGWTTVNGTGSKVNVWYRFDVTGQKEQAQAVSDAIENIIWPKLIGDLGFRPPLDDRIVLTTGCDGGSAKLDVYLVTGINVRALAVPEGLNGNQAPVFILVNTDQLPTDADKRGAIAHEFMHAIQWSYETKSRQSSYGWMRDAMANWAIDQVEIGNQLEQQYADCFTSTPALSLDDRSAGHCSNPKWPGVERDYGAYLFFQFIARTAGADKVKIALENTQSMATSLEAVDKAIPGGFKDQWGKFAKTLWNQAPINTKPDSFKEWDKFTGTPKQRDLTGDLGGAPEAREDFESDQNNLSSRYYHFTFADPSTRSVLFYNGFFDQIQAGKAIKILALWQDPTGAWQEEDWTNYKFVGLCRDLKNQRAKELTIIVANGEKDPGGKVTASKAPYLKRNNVGCYQYEGQVTMLEKEKGWGGLGRKAVLNLALGFFDPAMLQGLNGANPNIPNSLRAGMNMVMNNIGTDYSLEVNYTSGACTYTYGPVTRSLAWGTVAGALMLNSFPELEGTNDAQYILGFPSRGYVNALVDANVISVNVAGRGCVGPEQQIPGLLFSSGTDTAKAPVVMPDGTMQGSFADSGNAWTWLLTPKSEP